MLAAHLFAPESSRSSRQIQYQRFSPISWVQSLGEGSPCLANDGRLGSCLPYQKCFKMFKQSYYDYPNKWSDSPFLEQGSCSYFGNQAQSVPGVCCTSMLSNPIESNDPFSSGEQLSESLERFYQWPTQFGGFADSGFWPPPIPTHPPKQVANWPPPVPTHPPNHHYPTHPPSHGGPSAPTTSRPSTQRPITTTTKSSYKPTAKPPAAAASYDQCGVKNGASPDSERIVGGQNSSPHEFPWIVVLFNKGRQFCGGSLIDNIHVLTAAHCVAQ